MHVALTDGLALQILMDPGGVDVQLAAELWEDCVRRMLPPEPERREETAT
jgi:hypothetical protein